MQEKKPNLAHRIGALRGSSVDGTGSCRRQHSAETRRAGGLSVNCLYLDDDDLPAAEKWVLCHMLKVPVTRDEVA